MVKNFTQQEEGERPPEPESSGIISPSRREFLGSAGISALAVIFPLRFPFEPGQQNPPTTTPSSINSRGYDFSKLNSWITPNDKFYLRSHFGVPTLNTSQWRVVVSGQNGEQKIFTLDQIRAMPSRELVVTLECAGNLVGWGGVSNARWKGVSLKFLVEAAGAASTASEVILYGADGGADPETGGVQVDAFARAIPIAKALDPDTLVVYEMNGAPLPKEHGGPLRVIAPGFYGMDSVKWLTRIELGRDGFGGLYQTRKYYRAVRRADGTVERSTLHAMPVKSQFARPLDQERIKRGVVELMGAAWSGSGPIAKVLVSTDGGRTWQPAALGPDSARYAWRLWKYNWNAKSAGDFELMVKAIDAAGNEQPVEKDPTILTPYENNWIQTRSVRIIE